MHCATSNAKLLHYYLAAMEAIGSDTPQIRDFVFEFNPQTSSQIADTRVYLNIGDTFRILLGAGPDSGFIDINIYMSVVDGVVMRIHMGEQDLIVGIIGHGDLPVTFKLGEEDWKLYVERIDYQTGVYMAFYPVERY